MIEVGNFVGQRHIIEILDSMLDEIINGNNLSFLFIGPSGLGKTTLAKLFIKNCMFFTNDLSKYFPFPYYQFMLLDIYRYIIVDEIHKFEGSFESIYSRIDNKTTTFIFITTEPTLPEPFINRNIILQFTQYSDLELIQILINEGCPKNWAEEIIKISKIPRTIKNIYFVIKAISKSKHIYDINELLSLAGYSNGLSLLEREYLNLFETNKTLSLQMITRMLNQPRKVVLDIESSLLRKGLLKITQKGRELA